jgi:hypothetical protein
MPIPKAGENAMPESSDPQTIMVQLYGLPISTDVETLTKKAASARETLEEMGVFDQRDHEPAHFFCVCGEKKQ